jgi:hypothetical protein
MHGIYISISLLPIAIDPVEQEREEPLEPTPVEDTNPEPEQGKPQCIWPHSLSFISLLSYFMILDCALGHRSCIEALVA